MPLNKRSNEGDWGPWSGMFFVKDSNGNWAPVGKITDFSTAHSVCIPNPPPADIMITGEINLSDESAAQWWAISQGGIEIVER